MNVFVSGGSSGIGRAIAERFAGPDTDIFLNYHRDDAAAAEAVAAVEAKGARAHLLKGDIGDPAEVARMFATVRAEVDALGLVVHAAALAVPGPLLEHEPETLRHAIDVNALALVDVTREALPLLSAGSSVLFVSSRGAQLAVPGYGALGTAKAFAEHLVRYLAIELAGRGIRVNTISPGTVDTAALRAFFPDNYEQLLEVVAASNPSGRGTTMDDITDVVAQIVAPEFAWVQGQTIAIDGGGSLGA